MGNYVFRAQNNDIPVQNGEDIWSKNPNDPRGLSYHISKGTGEGTRFLSTTKSIAIAANFYGTGNRRFNDDMKPPISEEQKKENDKNAKKKIQAPLVPRERKNIILIDWDKLKENNATVYDCSSDEAWKELKSNGTVKGISTTAMNFAKASQEMIIEGKIPADCFRVIPPILVDVIDTLNRMHLDAYSQQICDMIMEDKTQELMTVINDVNWSLMERVFIKEHYQNMNNLHQVSKEFEKYAQNPLPRLNCSFKEYPLLTVVQGIKSQVMMDILSNSQFQELLESKDTTIPQGTIQKKINCYRQFQKEGFPDRPTKEAISAKKDIYYALPEGQIMPTTRDNLGKPFVVEQGLALPKEYDLGIGVQEIAKNGKLVYVGNQACMSASTIHLLETSVDEQLSEEPYACRKKKLSFDFYDYLRQPNVKLGDKKVELGYHSRE